MHTPDSHNPLQRPYIQAMTDAAMMANLLLDIRDALKDVDARLLEQEVEKVLEMIETRIEVIGNYHT